MIIKRVRKTGPEKKGTGSHRRKKGKDYCALKTYVLGAVLSLLQAGAAALFIMLNGTGIFRGNMS